MRDGPALADRPAFAIESGDVLKPSLKVRRRVAEINYSAHRRLSGLRGASRLLAKIDTLAPMIGLMPAWWQRLDNNFGDEMSPFLLHAVTGEVPIYVPRWYEGKVLGLGSIIGSMRTGDVVWGAGAISDAPIEAPPNVRFLAVRGPLTRGLLRADVPEVYGDPAMLLPLYYNKPQEPMYEVGVVPHFIDKPYIEVPRDPSILVVDVQAHWQKVVDDIRRCRAIASSSLHGLIVAESFGIPAIWITAGDRVKGGAFKFHDYYLATGRDPTAAIPWTGRIPEFGEMPPPQLDLEPLIAAASGISQFFA